MTKKNQKKLKTKNGIKILFFMCIGLIISFMIMLLGLKFFILHSKDDLIDLNLSMLKNGEASTVYFLT